MTLNCNGKLIDITTPKIMGILNITPDSFYDGGKYKDDTAICLQVENTQDVIIGGVSEFDIKQQQSDNDFTYSPIIIIFVIV